MVIWLARKLKSLGPTYPVDCQNCGRQEYHYLVKSRRWVKFVFIPIIPAGNPSHSLVCPNCNKTITISDPGEVQNATLAAELGEEHRNHILDTEKYFSDLGQLMQQSELIETGGQNFRPPDTDPDNLSERDIGFE